MRLVSTPRQRALTKYREKEASRENRVEPTSVSAEWGQCALQSSVTLCIVYTMAHRITEYDLHRIYLQSAAGYITIISRVPVGLVSDACPSVLGAAAPCSGRCVVSR